MRKVLLAALAVASTPIALALPHMAAFIRKA
jgi:hypothetical protein